MITQDYDTQAEFYDDMMPTLTEASVEIGSYAAALEGRTRILELGCGTGRISFPLIRRLAADHDLRSYRGIDYASEMVGVAADKLTKGALGGISLEDVGFEVGDAASFSSWSGRGGFDAAIALCGLTSLLGRERLPDFFRIASASLEAEGILIVDSLDPDMVKASASMLNQSYMPVSESSGLVSFAQISGDYYDADFVWISGFTARRFSERSDLIPADTLDEIAVEAGLVPQVDLSEQIKREVAAVNGPVMNFKVYKKS